MTKLLKPLAIAATLIATLAPTKADETIGIVQSIQAQPVCRDYDNAIEAEKLVPYGTDRSFKAVVDFVRSHRDCEILESDDGRPVAKVVQLPEEKVAFCVSSTLVAHPARCDYWMIVRRNLVMRNFDLPKEE
jgi:hypothetical protein